MLPNLTVVLLVSGAFYAILMLGYALGFLRELRGTRRSIENPVNGACNLSVVVPARDEEGRIEDCLSSILGNDFPRDRFEVIVVDDGSTDRTAEIVRGFAARNPTVRLETAPTGEGKKAAIQRGVDAARGEVILTTDADCMVPSGWLSTVTARFEAGIDMVAGPVLLRSDAGFLGKLAALESVGLVAISGGGIGLRIPSTCNGANLAYRKGAFRAVGGFSGIDHVLSGDDDMLMHKVSSRRAGAVRFCADRGAVVETQPPPTLGSFWHQRVRWASKGPRYREWKMVATLSAVYIFYVALVLAILIIPFDRNALSVVGLALLMKLVSEAIVMAPALHLSGQTHLIWTFLPGQLLQIPYVVLVGFAGAIGSYKWKGRDSQNS